MTLVLSVIITTIEEECGCLYSKPQNVWYVFCHLLVTAISWEFKKGKKVKNKRRKRKTKHNRPLVTELLLKIANKFQLCRKMIFTKNVRNQVNKNLNSSELTKNQSKLCLKPLNIRFENNYKLFLHVLFDTNGASRKGDS